MTIIIFLLARTVSIAKADEERGKGDRALSKNDYVRGKRILCNVNVIPLLISLGCDKQTSDSFALKLREPGKIEAHFPRSGHLENYSLTGYCVAVQFADSLVLPFRAGNRGISSGASFERVSR